MTGGLDIGRRFDAKPLLLPWPHCPHISIGGETGSGKSGVCNALIGAVAELPDVAICGIDLKLVELWPWRDRLTVLATTPDEADRLLVDAARFIDSRVRVVYYDRLGGIALLAPKGWMVLGAEHRKPRAAPEKASLICKL